MGPELVRTVDVIDAAVIGEGDEAFPRLLRVLAAGGSLDEVPVWPADRMEWSRQRTPGPPWTS